VDDYLSEREQWEWVKAKLRENLLPIAGGIALAAALVYGYRWWGEHRAKQAEEASAKYEEVITGFAKGDRTSAMTAIGELEREHASTPYFDQAQLAEAGIAVRNGQLDKAAATLQVLLGRTEDPQLALVARLRLARVQLALSKPDDALATLSAAKDAGAFEPRFQEVRGDIHLAKGDREAALKAYRAAQAGAVSGTVDGELLDLKINDLSDVAEPEK
jgi:predicted negative regulator of RcsB-dependent stress response